MRSLGLGLTSILVVLLVPPLPASAGTTGEAVDQCIRTIQHSNKRQGDLKKVELDFYCPGLIREIARSPLQKNLSYRFDSVSSIAELKDLRQFLRVSREEPVRTYHFKYQDVGKIVERVYQEKPKPQKGMWARLWDWLKEYLPTLDEEQSKKLDKLLNSFSVSERTGNIIFYSSSAIILIIALWIVYREWSYYRRAGGSRKSAPTRGSQTVRSLGSAPVSLAQMSRMPAKYRVSALLHWAIDFCVDRGELPSNHSLTSREMQRILQRNSSEHSQYFSDVVRESEKVVYGNTIPDEVEIERLLAGAQKLEATTAGANG